MLTNGGAKWSQRGQGVRLFRKAFIRYRELAMKMKNMNPEPATPDLTRTSLLHRQRLLLLRKRFAR